MHGGTYNNINMTADEYEVVSTLGRFSEVVKAAAEKCARVLCLDYCGVDLLFGDDDKPYVCEVNSNAFLGGIEAATGVNVAKAYAEYIIETVNKNK